MNFKDLQYVIKVDISKGKPLHCTSIGIDIFFSIIFWYFSFLLFAYFNTIILWCLAKVKILVEDIKWHILWLKDHLCDFAIYLNEHLLKHIELFQLDFYFIYKVYAGEFLNPYIFYSTRNQSSVQYVTVCQCPSENSMV